MGLALRDYTQKNSLRRRLRQQRFEHFLRLFEHQNRPVSILDIGGTAEFWRAMNFVGVPDCTITLLNVAPSPYQTAPFRTITGDGRDLSQFGDREFSIVFSNSVIEHVGTLDDQKQMAQEVLRVGRSHFLQTPNKYFPIEPHVQFPLFQFLPTATKALLHRNLSLATYPKANSPEQAQSWAEEIRLLTRRELATLFPNSRIIPETFLGMVKSFLVVYYDENCDLRSLA